MKRETKRRAVCRSLGSPVRTKGDELIFFCPKCRHKNPKLSLNLKTDWFHCWICDWSGKNLVPILRMSQGPELAEYVAERADKAPSTTPTKKYQDPALPNGFKTLSGPSRSPYHRTAMEYLAKRGLKTHDILRWKLGYCDEGAYRNRVIVPSFDNQGELNFVVGRSIYDDQMSYKHEDLSKDIIWNDYMIDWSKPVRVVEGPFDAFTVGENVAPLQGSILRSDMMLFRKIVASGQDVFFALDADALRKQLKIIKLFIEYGIVCHHVPMMGKKDPGSMTHDEYLERESHSQTITNELDLLRVRVTA